MERVSRSFASRKHPRYYKSYGMVPGGNEQRTLASQQISERIHGGMVPVSEAMREFDPM